MKEVGPGMLSEFGRRRAECAWVSRFRATHNRSKAQLLPAPLLGLRRHKWRKLDLPDSNAGV